MLGKAKTESVFPADNQRLVNPARPEQAFQDQELAKGSVIHLQGFDPLLGIHHFGYAKAIIAIDNDHLPPRDHFVAQQ